MLLFFFEIKRNVNTTRVIVYFPRTQYKCPIFKCKPLCIYVYVWP